MMPSVVAYTIKYLYSSVRLLTRITYALLGLPYSFMSDEMVSVVSATGNNVVFEVRLGANRRASFQADGDLTTLGSILVGGTVDGLNIAAHKHDATADDGVKITHSNLLTIGVNDHHAQSHNNTYHSTNYATKAEFDTHESTLHEHGHGSYLNIASIVINGIDYVIVDGHFASVTP